MFYSVITELVKLIQLITYSDKCAFKYKPIKRHGTDNITISR